MQGESMELHFVSWSECGHCKVFRPVFEEFKITISPDARKGVRETELTDETMASGAYPPGALRNPDLHGTPMAAFRPVPCVYAVVGGETHYYEGGPSLLALSTWYRSVSDRAAGALNGGGTGTGTGRMASFGKALQHHAGWKEFVTGAFKRMAEGPSTVIAIGRAEDGGLRSVTVRLGADAAASRIELKTLPEGVDVAALHSKMVHKSVDKGYDLYSPELKSLAAAFE